ncbi:MAG TPA: 4Fe-4S dicluster domain-containing protein [Methanomassiliicoccales archaeon]|nr:4Fe-4S dicluster domain-containing protein [Methanomassiliicoccales archaeon]
MKEIEDTIRYIDRTVPKIAKELAVRYARFPGIHIITRTDRCIGCGRCVKERYCRFDAISIVERKAIVNDRRCRGCMRCSHLCPRSAFVIELRPPSLVQDTLRLVDNEMTRILK